MGKTDGRDLCLACWQLVWVSSFDRKVSAGTVRSVSSFAACGFKTKGSVVYQTSHDGKMGRSLYPWINLKEKSTEHTVGRVVVSVWEGCSGSWLCIKLKELTGQVSNAAGMALSRGAHRFTGLTLACLDPFVITCSVEKNPLKIASVSEFICSVEIKVGF